MLYEGEVNSSLADAIKDSNIILIKATGWFFLYHILTSSTIIVGHSIKDCYISRRTYGRKIVNLWHGVPIKAIELAIKSNDIGEVKQKIQYSAAYDLMIASSYIDRLAMSSCFGVNLNSVFVTGLPRYDYLSLDTSLPNDLQAIESSLLTLINGKKLVLYAPTFRENQPGSTFSDDLIKELILLNEYCSRNGMILGVRFHVADAFFNKILPNNILILNSSTISETNLLLRHVSCLITDFSSIWIDYLLLDRPIIGYARDYQEYLTNDRGFLYSFFDVFPAKFFNVMNDVIYELESINCNSKWSMSYGKQKSMFHDNPSQLGSYTDTTIERLSI